MTIDIDLDQLEATAKAATQGLWEADQVLLPAPGVIGIFHPEEQRYIVRPDDDEEISVPDGAHIAAARPEVVLALIERVRTAEAALSSPPADDVGEVTRSDIADEISGIQVGTGYESTTIGIDAAFEAADAILAAFEVRPCGTVTEVDRPDHPERSCANCGHSSDCATHNEPAMPAGPCNCGKGKRS